MSLKKMTLRTTTLHRDQRLDQILTNWLPEALGRPVSKGKVRKLIIAGAVYLNSKRVRISSKMVVPNARIDVLIDFEKLDSNEKDRDVIFVMSQERVLFEDEDLIAVDKPPGLPTQPTLDEARDNLFLSVKKFLARRMSRPVSEVYLGLHHRLDRDTSGVVLMTKTQRANPGVAALFSQHLGVKTYQALASYDGKSHILSEWSVKNYLGRISKSGKRSKFGAVQSGGDFAHTDFKLLDQFGAGLWVEAVLHTGRTHQIRIHLSEGGMPIFGDTFYGGMTQLGNLVRGFQIPRLMLHARSLTFPHPLHQDRVSIHSSLPGDFNQCVKELQKVRQNS